MEFAYSSFSDRITAVHKALVSKLDFVWTDLYDRLLQWQLGNVTFSCGAALSSVSALSWDQNESISQFGGAHALMCDGSTSLLRRLAGGLDARCGHVVDKIDYSSPHKVVVSCTDGKKFTCDKVLLCLPLSSYKRHRITFIPPLPRSKQSAIENIGVGIIEKVAVRFPHRFWSKLLKEDGTLDYFGNVPKSGKRTGCFNIFYDFSTIRQPSSTASMEGCRRRQAKSHRPAFVLMSYICGEALKLFESKSDAEIVEEFVNTLQDLFPDQTVPQYSGYVVTHWGRDPHIGMCYSYLKVGGTGEDFDRMAECVDDRLYFAGECTNRFFPQTMTGAYVSALREAGKIAESCIAK